MNVPSVASAAAPRMKAGSAGFCSARAGFTLIELVISTALLSMILGGAYYCLRAGISTQEMVEEREEILQNGRVAMALLSADIRAACPLDKNAEFIGMQRTVGPVRADNLDFATHNYTPRRLGEGDWCEVSYFLDKDPQTGQFSLWRRRDPTRDLEPFSGGRREEIARGLAGLRFEYYDGFEWYDEWGDPEGRSTSQVSWKDRPNLSGMPEAVRISLWFASRDRKNATGPTEPPLVLETIARLNLAAVPAGEPSGGASTNSSTTPLNSAAPAPGGESR